MIRSVWPVPSGLVYEVDPPGERVIDVEIEGRRVWSFRESGSPAPLDLVPPGSPPESLRYEPWPSALLPRLGGSFRVAVRAVGEGPAAEAVATVGEGSSGIQLADVYGRPLVVNKWGRLGHALADVDESVIGRMLDHMDAIRELVQHDIGVPVFINGGTLLGPVRSHGQLIAHDDDADLAYLSNATSPADVARENFEIGRLLREHGYEVVRLSAAHLQIHFSHDGVPDHYVDLFAGFLLDGFWYQHFAVRTPAGRGDILPTSTVVVEGRPEPAPRDPELLLQAIYGPTWRIPDPAFTFRPPPEIADRLSAWFPDQHADREGWEDLVLLELPSASRSRERLSALAALVHRRTAAGHGIVDLGCGLGVDTRALAAEGRVVHGVDFSRFAVDSARRATPVSLQATYDVLNLLDIRQVIRLGAVLANADRPWTMLGRRLLNALEEDGRSNVFRLCSMVLRRGGAAYFDLVVDPAYRGVPDYLRPDVEDVVSEAREHGLLLEEAVAVREPLTWPRSPEERLVALLRMTFRWRGR